MLRKTFYLRGIKKGAIGYTIPESNVFVGIPPKAISTSELFMGKKIFLFAVPGAFTSNCNSQLPLYAKEAHKIKARFDVTGLFCVTTNDSFVCERWAKEFNVGDSVTIISDPGHSLLKNLGHEIDLPVLGGDRYARVAMIVDDGIIKKLWKEKDGKSLELTTPDSVLSTPEDVK